MKLSLSGKLLSGNYECLEDSELPRIKKTTDLFPIVQFQILQKC